MGIIVPFFQSSGFDPDTTKAMGEAFDAACKALQNQAQPDLVKEIMAKRILEAAKKGERDPHRLCAKALDALGVNRLYS